ncbi:chromosome segregation protein SMC [Spongisporangium articulatum]|uniref:Chromosome partition protein Smc n=1 Tax=Spongisporangium articulatum TaxID=3362603 RepID=A0ABW8AN18_9ACTN
MHLKTLTLRGFKSFASATTLRLEPGITCVVGPNGSGKSNVVDALSWVMGEQGAKSLRGGKMEDVIFAGTSGRPPLGRAEVSLTIDNTDGALPIDYTEVTISRTMFRSGGSEYAINGTPCRLLDIQELLSDSGIGREMHVIVGQGQLDAVLHASPEDRRAFIEEAAGVLKHRKRKEKAVRKLEAMQANLTRIADLTSEIRRQLKPLGRQAEVARRAVVVQADLRDARLRLLADDLVTAQTTLAEEVADETQLRERRDAVEAQLAETRSAMAELDERLTAAVPQLSRAQETWYRLSSLRERTRGTASLAADRMRLLSEAEPERTPGRDPDDLEAQAALVREQETQLQVEVDAAQEVLSNAVATRQRAEEAAATEERRLTALAKAAADRREGLARLAGKVAAQRSTVTAAQDQVARLGTAIEEAAARAERAAAAVAELDAQVEELAGASGGPSDLTESIDELRREAERLAALVPVLEGELDLANSELAAADARLESLRRAEREAHVAAQAATVRRQTLETQLQSKDGAGTLLAEAAADPGRVPGLVGSLAAALSVQPGFETAVAAALGPAAEAIVVGDVEGAVGALRLLADGDAGQATVVPVRSAGTTGAARDADPAGWPGLPAGARWARTLVQVPADLVPALDRLLYRVAVAPDLGSAADLLRLWPDVRVVTTAGDVVGSDYLRGGSASAPSRIEVQAAVEQAGDEAREAGAAAEQARTALAAATEHRTAAQGRVREVQEQVKQAQQQARRAQAELGAQEQRRAAAENKLAQQRGQLAGTARAAEAEVERLERQRAQAESTLTEGRAALSDVEERLALAEQTAEQDDAVEPSTEERDRLAAAATAARATETEARLALRTAEERARAVAGRADGLIRRAQEERAARARAVAREERRRRQLAIAEAVLTGARYALELLETALTRAESVRAAAQAERERLDAAVHATREQEHRLASEQARLIDSVHRDEVARAEQRMRIDALRTRSLEELGVDPEILIEEYGPHQLVPPSMPVPTASGDEQPDATTGLEQEALEPEGVPFDRKEQEKRLRAAERALNLLGTVNPLALEEFAALEERHTFLTRQLDDLKASRKDLMDIIKEVDERVEQVFAEAFADTAREFEGVFARLFPGGEGKLILTDPSNMLTTGLDVEARPPGKKVKRLSLLSGGERSLTAVALLVAIFKARPSPFYVMDEVEAALDDTNLGRLIAIFEELRESSQLIVITHQKRTMEVADALYGVTMRGDGVTTVISQRLREEQPA